jgi:hypothetical protein
VYLIVDGVSDVILRLSVGCLPAQEPICSISWQYSLTEAGKYGNRAQAYRLVTLSADGRVLVWVWHKLEAPLYGWVVSIDSPSLLFLRSDDNARTAISYDYCP